MQMFLLIAAVAMLLAHFPFMAYWLNVVNKKRAWYLEHAQQAKAVITEVTAPKKGLQLIRHEHGLQHGRRWYVVARLADPTRTQETFTLVNTKKAAEAELFEAGDVVDVWYAIGNPQRNQQLSPVEALTTENYEVLKAKQQRNQKNRAKILLGYAALVLLVAAGVVAAFLLIPPAIAG